MIFFCEDCGERNRLKPEQYETGKALFRCSSCHYLNSYTFKISEKKETFLNKIKKISSISGVDQYILVDQRGNITAHNIKNTQKAARMVLSLGRKSFAPEKNKTACLIVSKKGQKNIFIFPAGKYYLGVIKSKPVDNLTLVNNIKKFLKNLSI